MTTPTNSYDPVSVEIHRRALDAITNEMAITLTRTSGSPVIYDVQDFATSLLDVAGEQLSLSATVLFHSASSLLGTRAIIEVTGADQLEPGDGWIVNDPYTGGAMHQADIAIIMPLFYRGRHIAWAFSNVHVLDTGGISLAGFAPTAHSVIEEGLRFPPTRIIRGGAIEPYWERYLAANVRVPDLVLNDIRSMIAANNVAQAKLTELVDRFGPDTFSDYCTINKQLSEHALRGRIARLPDGRYETTDWIEYDGHGRELLLEVRCQLDIEGTELNFHFDGDEQIDAFVNGTPGLVHGSLMSTVMTSLCFGDVPFNSGIWRPISVNFARAGTVLNATGTVPVTGAHATAGTRVTKMSKELLNQAFSLSDDEILRGRVAGQAWDSLTITPMLGTGHGGSPTIVFFMDGVGGGGGGAQTTSDGLDTYGMTISPGVSLPSVEINESKQPALYLWRKIIANSGGPGTNRGGQSMHYAWAAYGTERLNGTAMVPCAEVPAHGFGGGHPAAGGTWETLHQTNVFDLLHAGRNPLPERIEGHSDRQPSNSATAHLDACGDVMSVRCGAGGGIGDPLLRDPELVGKDIVDGYVTAAHARRIYGVVLTPEASDVDEAATADQRAAIRTDRLGAAPIRLQRHPDTIGISVVLDSTTSPTSWACAYCDASLGDARENWRDAATTRVQPITDRYAQMGMFVRERHDPPVVLVADHFCPMCAGQLAVDVYPEHFAGYRSPLLHTHIT